MIHFKMVHGKLPSLQVLCLDSIIRKFERFNSAFIASKDSRLQRNMKFLQRRFSDLLACELLMHTDGKETDIYFDFLFNEHLTILDFAWFRSSRCLQSIDDIFIRLPNLLRLKFGFYGDEVLESVAKFCHRIVEIDASHSNLTDKGIKSLCNLKNGELPCPKLQNIVLLGSLVSNEGAECLIRCLPSVEKFRHGNLPNLLQTIYAKNLSQHQKDFHFNLTELYISEYRYAPDFIVTLKTCFTVCPKLKSIIWTYIRQEEELEAIIDSPLCLKQLNLDFSRNINIINIDNLLKAKGNSLTSLKISMCSVSAAALAMHCPALENFAAVRVFFTDDDPQLFFPSLTSCVLSVNHTDVKALSLLSSNSPKLKTLCLRSSGISKERISNDMKNEIIKWFRNPSEQLLMFDSAIIEMQFLNDIFLNCNFLKRILLLSCFFNVPNSDEVINFLSKKHKLPIIGIFTDKKDGTFINRSRFFSANHCISPYFCF